MNLNITPTVDLLPFLESQRDAFLDMAAAYGAAADILADRISELQAVRHDA